MNRLWNYRKMAAALGLATASVLLPVAAKAQSDGLAGTWYVQIQLHVCASGANLGDPFISLLTFDRGGTMTEMTSNPGFYPVSVRGPAHGIWKETGYDGAKRTYSSSQIALITTDGKLAEQQIIRQTITIGGDSNSFDTPSATVQFFNTDWQLVKQACATATGARFR